MKPPKSPKYQEALEMLPSNLAPDFEKMIEHYKFAATKHHGRAMFSPKVIAELILMGWRNTEEIVDETCNGD